MFFLYAIYALSIMAALYVVFRTKTFVPFGMITNTDRTAIAAEVSQYYDGALLKRALPNLIHGLWGQARGIKAGAGAVRIYWRRYNSLAVAGALSDGTVPTGKQATVTGVYVDAAQYGDWVQVTDRVTTESPDAVLMELSLVLGEQMGETLDELTRTALIATTTIQYASTATTNGTVTSAMTTAVADLDKCVRTLEIANARKVGSMINASTGVGTVPINAAYIGIVHPRTAYDLRKLESSGFIPVQKYANQMQTLPGEIGAYGLIRFVETSKAYVNTGVGSGGIDVYYTVIIGADAYGTVDLGGSQASGIIYKALGSAGASDPLNQLQTLGWKAYFASKILNDAFMVCHRHAVVA